MNWLLFFDNILEMLIYIQNDKSISSPKIDGNLLVDVHNDSFQGVSQNTEDIQVHMNHNN
jgi:hypothetical protein